VPAVGAGNYAKGGVECHARTAVAGAEAAAGCGVLLGVGRWGAVLALVFFVFMLF
jgi:hypothetical protein